MDFVNRIPFADLLGFELTRFDGGEADIALAVRPEQLNSGGVAHGGLLMTLLDVSMAHAARSLFRLPDGAPAGATVDAVTTVEMKTSFMRPGKGHLVASARVLTQTRALSFCEGSVRDAGGALVAHATGTFKRMAPRAASS